ncbi:hypothetical protein JMN32_05270 [Fulvivirga sp. 29W222]|uniref:HTH cro/C1-type domain-containing protein n=1 Tax=Fulvivirga marina TaxID=2494733 RepID=A0A937FVF0_9BACT|nr:helix-turn-helix transcriptional regulator [Fulvivirga marina]MBL6445708.1 hypothetical protein [Fulvivirga marina]
MFNKATIQEKVCHFRTVKGYSQVELGLKIEEITGQPYDRHAISAYETGRRRIPAYLVPVLAEIFEITTDELFYSKEEIRKFDQIDQLSAQMVDYRELSNTNPEEAAKAALDLLKEARKEIQTLKSQLAVSKNEVSEAHKKISVMKDVIKKWKKHVKQFMNYNP